MDFFAALMRLNELEIMPMEFLGGVGGLEARAENKSGPPDGGVVASAVFEMVGARPIVLVSRPRPGEIGGAGPSRFVACPTHARTTWEAAWTTSLPSSALRLRPRISRG